MVEMKAVDSSNVEAIGYDPDARTLHVRFKGGARYTYDDVSPAHHEDLIGAKSVGQHLYNNIIGKFPGQKMKDEDDGA